MTFEQTEQMITNSLRREPSLTRKEATEIVKKVILEDHLEKCHLTMKYIVQLAKDEDIKSNLLLHFLLEAEKLINE